MGIRRGKRDLSRSSDNFGGSTIDRRGVLRWGGLLAAGTGAAAIASPVTPAQALPQPLDANLSEAFAGVTVPPRALERWMYSRTEIRNVVCVGDSITEGSVGAFNYERGGSGSWVERLATAAGREIGPSAGVGYRGLWLGLEANSGHEWTKVGTWTRATPSAAFDVAPFGDGYYSSGGAAAILTWTKPAGVTVAGFDLYWFLMPGTGNWQYRVDGGTWTNMAQPTTTAGSKLRRFYVAKAVHASVDIRASNGTTSCLTPIAGIGIYSSDARSSPGLVVNNLGRDENTLANFVRSSSGDPLAILDVLRPALVVVMFSNDVVFNNTTTWASGLTTLVSRVHAYADVLLMNPFEQSARSATAQVAYRARTKTFAAANRCAVLDIYDAWSAAGAPGFASASAAGLMYDSSHPSQLGHNDIAARVWRMLRTFS